MKTEISQARFEPVRRIGSGGMGEVQLARMYRGEGPPQLVALKRIRSEFEDAAVARREFEREARITQLLEHPNIVPLRDYGFDDQGPFLALEYVDGLSSKGLLSWFLKLDEPIPLPALLALAVDISRGLHHAHGFRARSLGVEGIVHRDVSPDNVLIGRDGVARLSDFGIARIAGWTNYTTTGTAKGKLGYMAPELYEGGEASVRTDLFALAATLYRLATGVRAFGGKNDAEVMRSVLTGEVPPLEALRPDAPDVLGRFVTEALSRDPAKRPDGLGPFVAALSELLSEDERRLALAAAVERALERSSVERTEMIRMPLTRPTTNERARTASAPAPNVAPKRGARLAVAGAAFVVLLSTVAAGLLRATGDEGPKSSPPRAEAVAPVRQEPPAVTAEEVKKVATTPTPERPAAPPKKREPVKVAAASGPGFLTVNTTPWTMVELEDQPLGSTPIYRVSVPSGRHRVRLSNEALGIRTERYVEVKPGEVVKLDLKLGK